MKMLRRILYILPVIGIMIASCVDIESKDFEHIGGYNTMDNEESAQYYVDLRAWKATSQGYGRPIFLDGSATGLPKGLFVKDIWLLCQTASTWYRCGVVHSA